MCNPAPKIGIIVVGYNRPDCVSRLLDRLNVCDYPAGDIPLVISLDNCGKPEVYALACAYEWAHGSKTVLLQPQRLGLRQHILKCGSYIDSYGWDAAIVLEDDVYPAVPFYRYAQQAVAFYQDDDRIAGISLYTLTQNQTVRYPFFAAYSEYDAYFMQLAQSLGQVWMRRQWQAFVRWYEGHSASFTTCPGMPPHMSHWPDTSWLKYHIRYCIEENKYFVYPHHALTTNFGEIGANTNAKSCVLQTPLQQNAKAHYAFPKLGEGGSVYDAWGENQAIAKKLEMDVCIDLYGAKTNEENRRYWLTPLPKPFKIVASYGMELRPVDMNVLCDLPGNSIFLYDTHEAGAAPQVADRDIAIWRYYNCLLYPDPAIRKLAIPMEKKLRRARLRLLRHPKQLTKKLIDRLG